MPIKDQAERRTYSRRRAVQKREEYLRDKKCRKCRSRKQLVIVRKDKQNRWGRLPWQKRKQLQKRHSKNVKILCGVCYREEVYGSRGGRTHGTESYYRYGCRCVPCTMIHSIRMQKYKSRLTSVVNRR